MKQNLKLEPINGNYRIVSTHPNRPVVFEANLPLEIMEDIMYAFESRLDESYKNGFSEGYSQGWDDCLVDTFDK